MEGVCSDCGFDGLLHARGRCSPCYWRAMREAEKERCPGCGGRAKLRTSPSGLRCWRCRRREAPRKQPAPRRCRRCEELRLHAAHGLCSACYQRDPARVGVWLAGASERLGESCPAWFGSFADWLLPRSAPAVCVRHLRRVERAIASGADQPAALIAAVSNRGRSGRSPGDTARLLEAFLVERGLVLVGDEAGRLARGRRARRLQRCPPPLRAGVERYLDSLLTARERDRRLGARPLADNTIEQRLAVLAAFAQDLDRDGVRDWATCSCAHVEVFLAPHRDPGYRLAALRAFFGFATRARICLSDPTAGLGHRGARGFRGRVIAKAEQARLLQRWSGGECHPHEALVGLLALLHAASPKELRLLRADDIGEGIASLHLGRRRCLVPLDPLSSAAVACCLRHREQLGTDNPHLLVTRQTRSRKTPASAPYLSHVLDPAGVTPQLLRQTRLADLTHRLDPRLAADAFGITAEAALHYLVGAVDAEEQMFANL